MLLLVLPYYVTGVWTRVTLPVTAMTPMNGSMPAELSKELMADSTCQMVQISHVHLEDNVLGTAWSMRCLLRTLGVLVLSFQRPLDSRMKTGKTKLRSRR